MPPKTILIFGASGAGATTLGKAINARYNYTHLDTDDYLFIPTDPPFMEMRLTPERIRLMEAYIQNSENTVITGSITWGGAEISIIDRLSLAVRLHVDTDIRLGRVKAREARRFGNRILPGGDMYDEHTEFLEFVKNYDILKHDDMRNKELHDNWQKLLKCPVIEIDGNRPTEEILKIINSKYPF